IALSKAMYVMTPFTSLLVLENEDMYKQYKVDRGRKDHWAIYPAPKKIKVVREDDPDGKRRAGAKTAQEVLDTIVVRDRLRFLTRSVQRDDKLNPVIPMQDSNIAMNAGTGHLDPRREAEWARLARLQAMYAGHKVNRARSLKSRATKDGP